MTGKRIEPPEKPKKKWITKSGVTAFWMLSLTTLVSLVTLYLMYLSIERNFTGALYPLSALITLCQAGNAVVLTAITNKSKAENVKGGITYDAALGVIETTPTETINQNVDSD